MREPGEQTGRRTADVENVEVRYAFADIETLPVDESLLSRDERERAARFRSPDLARRFAACRCLLRRVLGETLGVAPAGLRFASDAHGKPGLPQHPRLHFNLSHCEDRVAIAVADAPVGIDVERVGRFTADDPLAATILAAPELAAWSALPRDARALALARAWVAKEAVLKACAVGLAGGELHAIALPPGDGPVDVPFAPGRWSLARIYAGSAHAAALCVAGETPRVASMYGLS
jgi:4'-phosphopantetheinyl transferase